MKKLIAASLFCAAAAFAGPSYALVFSDTVHVVDFYYPNFDGSIVEGGPESELTWNSAVYGVPFSIYLTDPGTDIISDVLYSLGVNGDDADILHFVSDGGSHPALGQLCNTLADNPTLQCVEETGALQDVTDRINAFIFDATSNPGIYDGGTVAIQSGDFTAAPEPATLAILGFGLAGLGLMRRKRAA